MLRAGARWLRIWRWAAGAPARLSARSAARTSAPPSDRACCTITATSWATLTSTTPHLPTWCYRSASWWWAASAAPRRVRFRWGSAPCRSPAGLDCNLYQQFSYSSLIERPIRPNEGVQLWTLPQQAQCSSREHEVPVYSAAAQQNRSELTLISQQRDQRLVTSACG